jgi:hypothetical protein
MLALESCMAVVVAIYYGWPAGAAILSRYATWQHEGGVLVAALATAFAGGVLSQVSLVYFQKRGRWTRSDVSNMAFRWVLFFISGAIVYEFYGWQAIWWGEGASLSVLVPKVLLDQFGYTVFWATPFFAILLRWQTLDFSGRRLWRELDGDFVTERMLPILVTNWMFWIPGVSLIYSMPSILQTPLFIFATAIWGLLLPAVTRQERTRAAAHEPLGNAPNVLMGPAE